MPWATRLFLINLSFSDLLVVVVVVVVVVQHLRPSGWRHRLCTCCATCRHRQVDIRSDHLGLIRFTWLDLPVIGFTCRHRQVDIRWRLVSDIWDHSWNVCDRLYLEHIDDRTAQVCFANVIQQRGSWEQRFFVLRLVTLQVLIRSAPRFWHKSMLFYS